MTSKRFVFFIATLVIIAVWLLSRPSRESFSRLGPNTSSDGIKSRNRSRQPASEEANGQEKTRPAPPIRQVRKLVETVSDTHGELRKSRSKKEIAPETLSEDVYQAYRERLDVKATPLRAFDASMGKEVAKVANYSVFRDLNSTSLLNDFDGKNLPVVVDKRNRMGIVNGEIRILFKKFPPSLSAFASQFDLQIVSSVETVRLAFVTPKSLPAAILDRVKSIAMHPDVKSAELDITFSAPVA